MIAKLFIQLVTKQALTNIELGETVLGYMCLYVVFLGLWN